MKRLSFLLIALLPLLGHAQMMRTEIVPFQTSTPTDAQFLNGEKNGQVVTIAGLLKIPKTGTDRLAAVILLHGSGGTSGQLDEWEQEINQLGIATFTIDSWSGRGIRNVVTDQGQVGRTVQIVDAFRGFEVLEKHPRIDANRIAVMGFSRGGQAALYSGLKRFQASHGPASGKEFRGYIALYPTCVVKYQQDDLVTANPIRIFHGEADNWVPVDSCRTYANTLKTKGYDVVHVAYPNAHHVYDWKAYAKPVRFEKAQSARGCALEEEADGVVINSKTRQQFDYHDPCISLGTTVAYDEAATIATRKAVKLFLEELVK